MAAKWPTAVAADADLYVAVNSLQTTLSTAVNNSVTSVVLASSTGFPTAGAVTIDNEVIFYTGISGATLTGCTRGADGTTAASHSAGVPVGASIVAFHHNGLMAEIEAIESNLSSRFGLNTNIVIPSGISLTVNSTAGMTLGAGTIALPDGTVSAPSLSRSADATTGIYFTSGSVRVGIGSANVFRADSTGVLASPAFVAKAGTAGAPTYTFDLDPDTGFYNLSSVNVLGIATGGVLAAQFNASQQLDMQSHKIISLANGTASSDAAAFGQLKLLQAPVIGTSGTSFSTTSNSYQSTNLTASITPTSASSRIMVIVTGCIGNNNGGAANVYYTVFRGSTDIGGGTGAGDGYGRVSITSRLPCSFSTIDSPATTSSTTYTVKIKNDDNATSMAFGITGLQTIILLEIV